MRITPRSRRPFAGPLCGALLAAALLRPAPLLACDPATWSAADSLASPARRLLDQGISPLQGAEAAALPQPGVGWSHLISVQSNSYNPDCNPWVTWDGRKLFFITIDNLNGPPRPGYQGSWDIYEAEWDDAQQRWGTPVNVGPPINTADSERRPSATATGDTLFYGGGPFVWVAIRSAGAWSQPVLLFEGSDPCITVDVTQIYYARGGDIWLADRGSTLYQWVNHRPLPPPVNSPYGESRPFISFDKTKLFWTDAGATRPGGYGGYGDLWFSNWTGTAWGPPVNVGPPINTDRVACTPYLSADGRRFYTASESFEGSRGDEDVWVAFLDSIPAPREVSAPPGAWTKCGELPGAWNVYDLIEAGDGALYAATSPGGFVYRSDNAGESWTALPLPGVFIAYSLLAASDGALYAGTYPFGDVLRSTDRGASWGITADLPGASTVRDLIETSDGRLLAAVAPGGTIFSSANGGLSWTPLATLPVLDGSGITCLFQASNGHLYAGGWGPIYRSTDGGAAWAATDDVPFPPDQLKSIDSFYQTQDGVLWATGWVHGHGGYIFKTTDAAAGWDTTGTIRVGGVHAVRVYTMDEDPDGLIRIGYQPGPDSVACVSADGGATWQAEGALAGAHEILALLRTSAGTLFATTTPNGDVFRWNAGVTGVPGEQVLLSPAVPNPSRSSVTLAFRLPRAGRARLTIVDVQGRRVRALLDARLEAGEHAVSWDGRDDDGARIAAGLYFLRVDFGGRSSVQKLVALR